LDFNRVSTVILGATRPEQLEENVKALEALEQLRAKHVFDRIDEILGNVPDQGLSMVTWKPNPKLRRW